MTPGNEMGGGVTGGNEIGGTVKGGNDTGGAVTGGGVTGGSVVVGTPTPPTPGNVVVVAVFGMPAPELDPDEPEPDEPALATGARARGARRRPVGRTARGAVSTSAAVGRARAGAAVRVGQVDAEVRHDGGHAALHRVGQGTRRGQTAHRDEAGDERRHEVAQAESRTADDGHHDRTAVVVGGTGPSRVHACGERGLGAGAGTAAYRSTRSSSTWASFMRAPPRNVVGATRGRGVAGP